MVFPSPQEDVNSTLTGLTKPYDRLAGLIGERLRYIRDECISNDVYNVTQESMAEWLGLTVDRYQKLENGECVWGIVYVKVFAKIFNEFNVTFDDMTLPNAEINKSVLRRKIRTRQAENEELMEGNGSYMFPINGIRRRKKD